MGFMLGYHCVKRMCLCIYAHVHMCTQKSILFGGNFLEDCVAYSEGFLLKLGAACDKWASNLILSLELDLSSH